MAIDAAMKDVESGRTLPVPEHLRDASYRGAQRLGHGQGYQYAHDFPEHFVAQDYLGAAEALLRAHGPGGGEEDQGARGEMARAHEGSMCASERGTTRPPDPGRLTTYCTEPRDANRPRNRARAKGQPEAGLTPAASKPCLSSGGPRPVGKPVSVSRARAVWSEAATVLFYAPMGPELDVWPLVAEALANGKQVAPPPVHGGIPDLPACRVADLAGDIAPGKFGIREPRQSLLRYWH